jgi:hypothetical protein
MLALELLPAALSLLVLAAHFLRRGRIGLVIVPVVIVGLLFVRRRWAARAVQGALGVGLAVWLVTLYVLVSERLRTGRPVVRLALILGAVAAFTTASLLAFLASAVRRHFRLDGGGEKKPG